MRIDCRLRKHVFFCIAFVLVATITAGQATAPADSMLLNALSLNNKDEVARLLKLGANANAADKDGDNALMYAALYASSDCMKLLLDNHADVNNRNKVGESALMWSTHNISKLTLLVDHGADINLISNEGNNAVVIAAKGLHQYPALKYLLDRGADCLLPNKRKETALFKAAELGDTATLQLLVDKGSDLTALSKNDLAAVHFALFSENFDAALWLIRHMPAGKKTDTILNYALTYAAGYDNIEVMQVLAEKATDINWMDKDELTPLMWAVYNENVNEQIIKLLLSKKANPYIKGKDGLTAMDWAMKKNNRAIVDLLTKQPKD
jgi:ankyrin repeat protein